MLQPDFKEFSQLARETTLVPVVKSVSADLLTPVSAFLAIAEKQSHAFLLESIERGEQIGRYTFLGSAPYMRVTAHKGKIQIDRRRKRELVNGSIFQVVKRLLREHSVATVPGLPPFTAGAVGYFAYDVVRQLENIGEHAKDDLSVPDAELMFFDRLLAFDHLRHQIHIMAAADVSRENPRRAYDRALRDIAALERKLAAGLSPALWRKTAKPKTSKLKIHAGTRRDVYLRNVERCKEYIAAGDIFQVVYSQRFDFTPEVAPFDLYRALRQVNPSPYLYFLKMNDRAQAGIPADCGHTSPRPRRSRRCPPRATSAQRRKRARRTCDAGRSRTQRPGARQRVRLGEGERPDVRRALLPRHAPGISAGGNFAKRSRRARCLGRVLPCGNPQRRTESSRHADH
jgi:anthranilate synthase component 1